MTTGTLTQQQPLHVTVGRRKCAVAQVRLSSGNGNIIINGKPLAQALPTLSLQTTVLEPFQVTGYQNKLNAMVKVRGGGTSGQAIAVRHGIARALLAMDEKTKLVLRKAGFLTRDPRVKERKHYGLKRARKAPQYTKR